LEYEYCAVTSMGSNNIELNWDITEVNLYNNSFNIGNPDTMQLINFDVKQGYLFGNNYYLY